MQASSRFLVATHLLVLAALDGERPDTGGVTSARMAASVTTNPVVARRLMGMLRAAGLVTARAGPGGGWRLARDPGSVTLRDIYRAVEPGPLFAPPQRDPSPHCPVGRGLPPVMARCLAEAEEAMEGRLAMTTLADVLAAVRSGCAACGGNETGLAGEARQADAEWPQEQELAKSPRTS